MSSFFDGAAAAGIGGASNLVGTLIGNNAAAKEAQKQREWQEKMWHMQNEYNSPKAMIERGLNPYLNPSAGVAGSAGQGAAAAQSPAQLGQGIAQGLNSVGAFLAQLAQSKKATAESALIGKDLEWKDVLNQVLMQQSLGDTNYKNLYGRGYWTKQNAELSAQLGQTQEMLNVENAKQSISLMHAQSAYTALQADAQKILNKYQNAQQTADLYNKAATYHLLVAQKRMTTQQAITEISKQVLNDAQANKLKMNTPPRYVAEAIFDSLAATSMYDADAARYRRATREYEVDQSNKYADRNTKYWQSVNGSIHAVGSAVGNILGGLNPLKGLFKSGNQVGTKLDMPNYRYNYHQSY